MVVVVEEVEVEGEEKVVILIRRGRQKGLDVIQAQAKDVVDVVEVVEIDHRPPVKLKTKTEKGLNNNDQ